MVPVEGYSNFLWVVLLSVFYKAHLFDPIVTPKLLAVLLTGTTFAVLYRLMTRRCEISRPVASVALLLLALQPAFVAWAVSGLENPLYVCLLSILALLTLDAIADGGSGQTAVVPGRDRLLGLTAAAVALTRPEGIVYAAAYPTLLLLSGSVGGRRAARLRAYLLPFTVIVGLLFLFRHIYFHALLPNTFYAKENSSPLLRLEDLLRLRPYMRAKLLSLLASVAGNGGPACGAGLIAACALLLVRRKRSSLCAVIGVFIALAGIAYLALPPDWMPEFRFASPFYLFLYPFAAAVLTPLFGSLSLKQDVRGVLRPAALALLLAVALRAARPREQAFADARVVSMQEVAHRFGDGYNRCAEIVGAPHGSLLVPDVGGALLVSHLRIYDLGGLCDGTITRTIAAHTAQFHDYVFETTRPTFIHTHGWFAMRAQLDKDPRFRRDYVAIQEWPDAYCRLRYGKQIFAGDYVRKEILSGNAGRMAALRQTLAGKGSFYR